MKHYSQIDMPSYNLSYIIEYCGLICCADYTIYNMYLVKKSTHNLCSIFDGKITGDK